MIRPRVPPAGGRPETDTARDANIATTYQGMDRMSLHATSGHRCRRRACVFRRWSLSTLAQRSLRLPRAGRRAVPCRRWWRGERRIPIPARVHRLRCPARIVSSSPGSIAWRGELGRRAPRSGAAVRARATPCGWRDANGVRGRPPAPSSLDGWTGPGPGPGATPPLHNRGRSLPPLPTGRETRQIHFF
jgi:hypothetical protein